MKKVTWLMGACLLGGWMTLAVWGGVRGFGRAADAGAACGPQELLRNPGFESATGGVPDAWEKWGGSLVQTAVYTHGGSYAGALTTTATSGLKYVCQTISVTPQTTYQFSGWMLENDPNLSQAFLRVRWYASTDGSGSALSNADSTQMLTSDDARYRPLTTGAVTSPLEARSAKACFYVRVAGGSAGVVYLDDASLQIYTPPPNLAITKRGAATAASGDFITYHITLSNTGSITVTGVRVTDTLPAGVEFVAQSGPFTCTPDGKVWVWEVGDMRAGERLAITVTGRITAAAPLTLTNRVSISIVPDETATGDNSAIWTTTVKPRAAIYLPILLRNYTPPAYWVIIEAVLYDGLQLNDTDEAVMLFNGGDRGVDLTGWQLCKWGTSDWSCAALPATTIAPGQRLWLARNAMDFAASFGFASDYVLTGWPALANTGDEVVLRDAQGAIRDTLVYKNGLQSVGGWSGPVVRPYAGFSEAGQVLYRTLAEETGRPAADTDSAADWAQTVGYVRYPGWDLERFFRPAVSAGGVVTAGIAPDHAYALVAETIRSAQERIEAELYSLEHYSLTMELVGRARAGVSVTVLLEGGPVGGVASQELWACQQLEAAGGRCYFMVNSDTLKIYDRYTFVHAKFIVVDRARLLVGSQNLTYGGLPGDAKANGTGGSRGVVLVTDAPEVVARAVDVFRADCDLAHRDIARWGPTNPVGLGAPPPGFTPAIGDDWVTYTVQFPHRLATTGEGFELITAPESALRVSDALLGLVARAGAGDAVYVEQLYEHADWGADPLSAPNPRLEAYLAAARRGARVRILLNGGNFGIPQLSLAENTAAVAYINGVAQAEGLDLSAHLGDPTQYGIHNKMVLVDLGSRGKYAHIGSINGSETSSKVNREMALQVRSEALFAYLYAMFDYDWNHQPPQRHLLISEVMYRPSTNPLSGEWVEIYNPSTVNVDISGWYLGDVGAEGEYGSGLYRFPAGSVLVAEGVIVIAQQAGDVTGFAPDYEFLLDPNRDDGRVPNMIPVGAWDGFGFALGNDGDEVLLLDAAGNPVDVVVYGGGSYPGVIPHPGVNNAGRSLERRPPRQDSDDCSVDFFERYPPTPGALP